MPGFSNQTHPVVLKPPRPIWPRRAGGLGLLVFLPTLLSCAPQAVPYPQPGMAIWRGQGGGAIEGSATLRSGPSGYPRTCAGFDAYVVPVTTETTAFVRQHFSQIHNGYSPSRSVEDALGTFITTNGGGRVPCRDDGSFTFAGLAAGHYYVFADITWLLRWAHEGGTVSTIAEVSPTRTTGVSIEVALNTRDGTSNVPR